MFNRATQVVSIVSTKGGVGKTTLAANMSALLADFGFRVLMIDADVQPSLSKYYPLSYTAPNGIVELMLGENNDNNIRSCISHTVYPNLDIVLSNNISGEIQTKIQVRPDRAVLLKSKLIHPIIRSYDFVIIDTQGAVGALQDAAAFAADLLL
ncbi:MAG: AAA family ATPase [Neisseriaceae bacterium]|nr:AAA family ATPase [Neisseriaceae bacterium]